MYKIYATIYITIWVMLAFNMVGSVIVCSGKVVTLWLPLGVLYAVGIPAWLGYMIGREK